MAKLVDALASGASGRKAMALRDGAREYSLKISAEVVKLVYTQSLKR